MNKSDLIKALKDEANLTKPQAKAAVRNDNRKLTPYDNRNLTPLR